MRDVSRNDLSEQVPPRAAYPLELEVVAERPVAAAVVGLNLREAGVQLEPRVLRSRPSGCWLSSGSVVVRGGSENVRPSQGRGGALAERSR